MVKYISLNNCAIFSQGKQVPVEEQSIEKFQGSERFVRIVDFTSDNEQPRYIHKFEGNFNVKVDDLVMIRYGSQTAGKVVRGIKGIIANNMFKIDIDKNLFDINFAYYYLSSDKIYKMLMNVQSSSTMPAITFGMLGQIELPLFTLETQQKIVKVLSAIDDKIELNNSINNNLEQLAQAIFKSWFVDFEPFGGTMPDNWKVVDLGDICNISAGGDKPSKFSVIQTQEFQIPIYSNGINNEGLYGYTNYAKINNESVTISARGTIGYTCLRLNPFFPIVRLICIEPKNRLFSAKYLYQAIKRMDIVGFGTTQQQITVPYCKTLKILLPSKEYLYKYANIVDRLYKEIFENKNENIKLIQLRDTILPKLMNGEIDVSKVDISADKLLFSED